MLLYFNILIIGFKLIKEKKKFERVFLKGFFIEIKSNLNTKINNHLIGR